MGGSWRTDGEPTETQGERAEPTQSGPGQENLHILRLKQDFPGLLRQHLLITPSRDVSPDISPSVSVRK